MLLLLSLFAGLVMTFAFEIVLMSLGTALSLSLLHLIPASSSDPVETESSQPDFPLPITHLVGFGIALSLASVLFSSSFAVTLFGQVEDPRRGCIFGIILWATYWLLLIWLSSTTLASIADSLIGAAALGSKRLLSAFYQAVRGEERQNSSERDMLQSLAQDISQIAQRQAQLPQLLAQQQQILLEEVRSEIIPIAKAASGKAASGDETLISPDLAMNDMASSSTDLIPNSSSMTTHAVPRSMSALRSALKSKLSDIDFPSWKELLKRGISQLNWSEWDFETLWYQLKMVDSDASPSLLENAIIRDAEDFIRGTPIWSLHRSLLESEFYERIYDPHADPQETQHQLMQLSRESFLDWLSDRGDLSSNTLEAAADKLLEIRNRAMDALPFQGEQDTDPDPQFLSDIQEKLVNYCRYTNKGALTCESMANKVRDLQESESDQRWPPIEQALDLDELQAVLTKRNGIPKRQWRSLIQSLRDAWPEPSHDRSTSAPPAARKLPRPWIIRTVNSSQDLWHQLTDRLTQYLSFQEKEALIPEKMTVDLNQMLQAVVRTLPDPSDLSKLSGMMADETKATWKEVLENRRDITQDEINSILIWCDAAWTESVEQAEQVLQSFASTLSQATPSPESLKDSGSLLAKVGQQLSEPIELIQGKVEEQVDQMVTDLKGQAIALRKQAEIASWWLFLSLLCSGISAGFAGWMAVLY